jgi:hypothetical protein
LEEVLIAEDDVKFTAPYAFDYFLLQKPKDFDIYLGGISYGQIDSEGVTSDFSGLHLYIIKSRFYDEFLALDETIDIDRTLAGKGKFIVCNPFVAIQHNGYSDNKQRHEDLSLYFKGRKLFGH